MFESFLEKVQNYPDQKYMQITHIMKTDEYPAFLIYMSSDCLIMNICVTNFMLWTFNSYAYSTIVISRILTSFLEFFVYPYIYGDH